MDASKLNTQTKQKTKQTQSQKKTKVQTDGENKNKNMVERIFCSLRIMLMSRQQHKEYCILENTELLYFCSYQVIKLKR